MNTDADTAGQRQPESPGSIAAWMLASSALHLCLWLVVCCHLCYYVPRQMAFFEDFSVALPPSAILVFELSDLTVSYWYFLFPFVFVSVIGLHVAIVAMTRSRAWRLALIALLAIPPIGWLVGSHLILATALEDLLQNLQ